MKFTTAMLLLTLSVIPATAFAQITVDCTAEITQGKGMTYHVINAYATQTDAFKTRHTFSVTQGTPNGNAAITYDWVSEKDSNNPDTGYFPTQPGATYGSVPLDGAGKWSLSQAIAYSYYGGPTYPSNTKTHSILVKSNIKKSGGTNVHKEDSGTCTVQTP